MKIYTKTGDNGSTGLIGGTRVSKADPRLDCYGTVDELNAAIGLAVASLRNEQSATDIIDRLHAVQAELFIVGSHLATPDDNPHRQSLPPLDEAMSTRLEREIDTAETELPPLKNFILPGGTEAAARLHLARTICRRAERLLVGFSSTTAASQLILIYLNRLSDWLFVQARLCNHRAGVADIPWKGK